MVNRSNYKKMNLRSKCLSGQFAIVIGIKLKIRLSTIKKYELDEYVEEELFFDRINKSL